MKQYSSSFFSKALYGCLLLFFSFNVAAQEKHSTFYYQRATLFEKLPTDTTDIVFLGNSITNSAEWAEIFQNPSVKNRGISGDICQGVYDRLDPVVAGKPAKIFLMIGVNDLSRGASIDSVAAGIDRIVCKIQTESPRTEIFLQSVLPVNADFGMFAGHTKRGAEIRPLNEKLQTLAAKRNIVYIDLFSQLTTPGTELLNPAYTNDGLHLLGEGYLKWKEIVEPFIR